jgi:hypothetical protein
MVADKHCLQSTVKKAGFYWGDRQMHSPLEVRMAIKQFKTLSTYKFKIGFALAAAVCLWLAVSPASADQVEPLPDNNLVCNPWFRSSSNPNRPSFEHWQEEADPDGTLREIKYWSLSQKTSNPSPDAVNGTGARMAAGKGQGGGGEGAPNVDTYLSQVIVADSAYRDLSFQTHWVTINIVEAKVTIYGSVNSDGPWTEVWQPFRVDQSSSSSGSWLQTELLHTTIDEGYPYYKIVLHAHYPPNTNYGVKYTGVYLAASMTDSIFVASCDESLMSTNLGPGRLVLTPPAVAVSGGTEALPRVPVGNVATDITAEPGRSSETSTDDDSPALATPEEDSEEAAEQAVAAVDPPRSNLSGATMNETNNQQRNGGSSRYLPYVLTTLFVLIASLAIASIWAARRPNARI